MDVNKQISIRCGGEISLDYKLLNHFQGKLKSISDDHFKDLKNSLIKQGLPLAFHAWKDDKGKYWTIDGHHRVMAFKALESEGYFIPPVPCNLVYAKTKKEAAQILLVSNSRYAKMSQESISDFMIDMELSLPDLEFLDIPELDMSAFLLENNNGSDPNGESLYTDKIESPIYTPKGPKPKIEELFDTDKYDKLVLEIAGSNLPENEKRFLTFAAKRHIVFNYQNIAEYYSHSDKDTQELMENSALVIIDFNKAVENGFVKLSTELSEVYSNDN